MKDHKASKQETIIEFNKQIEVSWKDLNEGFLKPTTIPVPLLDRIYHFAQLIDFLYKEGDYYTHVGPEMQHYIRQILIDPVPE